MFRKTLEKFLKNDAATMVYRLALVYVLYFIARVVFYVVNAQSIGAITLDELPGLLRGGLLFDTASVVYINSIFIILSVLPFKFREKPLYQTVVGYVYVVFNSLAFATAYSDVVYFRYVQKRFTAIELFFTDNDNSLLLVLKFVAENWGVFICWLLTVAALVVGVKKIKHYPTLLSSKVKYYAVCTAIFLLSMLWCVSGIRGGLSRSVRPITLSNASLYSSSIVKSNLVLSNPFCIIRTLGYKQVEVVKYFDSEGLEDLFSPVVEPSEGEHFGKYKDYNVVLFVLESFSAEHSAKLNPDLYPDGQGFTPFLDSLMSEGYTFTSGFANGRKSIDALPSVLSSIPSYQTPFVLMPNSMCEKESMPMLLAERGYRTMFFNGSDRGSMGFGAYASQAGIQEYISRENYEKERGNDDFDGFWGIWDEPFIDYMGEKLSQTKEPFFASIFTLSSHHPFVVPEKYSYLPKGKTKIHQGVQYTDLSIRKFFEKYGSEEWFKKTLFVFTADHVSSEVYAPKTKTPTGNSHIIYFYYSPENKISGLDNKVAQQIDIMPTVLNLVGVDRPYFAFGSDVMNEGDTTQGMVVNWVGSGCYQAITDSVVVFFDSQRVLGIYNRSDTLQTTNIKDTYIDSTDILPHLKARIQQYYQHVADRDYKLN